MARKPGVITIVIAVSALLLLNGCYTKTAADGGSKTSSDLMAEHAGKAELRVYQIISNTVLKAEPNEESQTITKLSAGLPVNVIEKEQNGWYKIKSGANCNCKVSGFIKNKYLRTAELHDYADKIYDPYMNWPGVDNYYERYQKLEEKIIREIPDLAARNGEILYLKLANGKTISLTDVDNSTLSEYYSLIDFKEDANYFIVAVSYWEGGDFLLINRANGSEITVVDIPMFSPDHKRFVVAYPDLPGYSPSQFVVYKLAHDKAMLEFELTEDSLWSASNQKWINNEEIEFSRNYLFNGYYVYFRDRIILRDNKWITAGDSGD